MAYWGMAYAVGPNYNKSWIRYDLEDLRETVKKAQAALAFARAAHNTRPVEEALIEALSHRFPLEEAIPEDFGKLNNSYIPPMVDWVEFQAAMPAHVRIRFGRWEEILQLELREDKELFCITNAMIHYAKGVALSALGWLQEAEVTKAEFEAARRAVPDNRQYGIACKAQTVLEVPSRMLEGELAYRKGNFDQAFAHLREGVRLEDMLPYADPPVWLQPVRHALGALLLEQGCVDEAEEVYKQDLGLTGYRRRFCRHPTRGFVFLQAFDRKQL
ncbi:hypothetical protein ACKRZS_007627 [Fusarium odoratissimum]